MLLRWTLFILCLSIALCVSEHAIPNLPPGESPKPILNFMEQTYKSSRCQRASGAGVPLLLSPYIENNRLDKAREDARVDADVLLPDMESYAGYLTVNKEYNSNLWFWYFPVADQPIEETPWIIWLHGGPGVSSLYGLFTEMGPLVFNTEHTLEEMTYSWGKNHSLLFIDNPVGTGYSFTDDDRGYATNQTTIGENLYSALQQFLTIFPELREAPLIIAGSSYAGKYIPPFGVQIHRNKNEHEPINLQGLAIGNGYIDPKSLQRLSYLVREIGVVDDRVADVVRQLENAVVKFIDNGEMNKAYTYYNYVVQVLLTESKLDNLYHYLENIFLSLDESFLDYIQNNDVRKALHVGNTNFTTAGIIFNKLVPDFMNSSKPWLEELLDNYRVLLYNGHLDIIVGYHPSVNTYNALNFAGKAQYKTAKRLPWYHNKELAGYYKKAGNLLEVMVRGAGHIVPINKPSENLGLISAFARNISLDEDTGYLARQEKNSTRFRQLQLSSS